MVARLFVALPVAASVTEELDQALEARRAATDWAWTRPEGWHLTLAFLGEVYDDVGDIAASVSVGLTRVGAGRVQLSLAAPGTFRGGRLAYYAVDDQPAGVVARLGESVQASLEEDGFPVDRKPVRPHLTVARARGSAGRCDIAALPRVDGTWSATHAEVMQSHLAVPGQRDGVARYEVVARSVL